ncbi:hypothetical protein [Leptospira ilyithenensis]|uniref:Uncharacterized protein n=1 Tax=Leptospira ilyithenensis TaxID=2484901 RepID=A0A4R9LKS0_9LEPT|nr:hypothetical protein [Leptospira ilyithenensis]TGN06523.1 hypothetical protein EHS11_19415 [Leptospira ilyithenensis]
MGIVDQNFGEAFRSSFREFFGEEGESDWEIYDLISNEELVGNTWMTFTVRNPLAGRALVFRYDTTEHRFYAFLKVQVIPGEEDWNLDQLFKKKGYTELDSAGVISESGEWLFHSLARHYFSIILSFCPRILEPDFVLD